MSHPVTYNTEFYELIQGESYASAKQVVPILLEYVPAESVIDVGCGVGAWLRAFQEAGIADIAGIEGSRPGKLLQVDRKAVHVRNLRHRFAFPRQFDLALCLEVAEHLPAGSAGALVDSLTHLAPVIAFSAAIPGQGGTRHINEQWPAYWAGLFSARGWTVVDCIRRRIWGNLAVAPWYAQNLLVYVRNDALQHYPRLSEEAARTDAGALALVHPQTYLDLIASPYPETFRHTIAQLPRLARRALRHRLARTRIT